MVIAKSFHLVHRQRVNLVIEFMSKDIRMRNMGVNHVTWNWCSEIETEITSKNCLVAEL